MRKLGLPSQPKLVFGDVVRRYRFNGLQLFVFGGKPPATSCWAVHKVAALDLKKPLDDDGLQRLLDDEAGDVVRRVDHAVAFAFAINTFGWCPCFWLCWRTAQGKRADVARIGNAFQVADALLKNAAQHGDADFVFVVVTRQRGKARHQFVANGQGVKRSIG